MKFITILLPVLFIFSACEIETDESNRYDVLKHIDDGEFHLALEKLGNCDEPKGFSKEECHINRGVSYFGLAGYDITTIGEEMYKLYSDDSFTDDEKSIKITSILFSKFRGDNMKNGLTQYKLALNISNINESLCNLKSFNNLTENQKQSCISINPILLLDIIDDKNSFESLKYVDLDDIINIENSIRGVVPNISSEEIVHILNNNIEKTSSDTQNEIDATQCLIDKSSCFLLGFKKPEYLADYKDIKIWKIGKGNNRFSTIKLTNSQNSIILLEENSYILEDETSCSETEYKRYDGVCFPKPVVDNLTLTSSIVDKLNEDDNFKDSIALILNVGDNTNDEDDQVNNFMTDICGSPDCKVTEENLIQYFDGKE